MVLGYRWGCARSGLSLGLSRDGPFVLAVLSKDGIVRM